MALPCTYACMQYACDAVSVCVNGISVIRSRTFEEYTFQHSMSLLKIYFFLFQEQQQQQPLSSEHTEWAEDEFWSKTKAKYWYLQAINVGTMCTVCTHTRTACSSNNWQIRFLVVVVVAAVAVVSSTCTRYRCSPWWNTLIK